MGLEETLLERTQALRAPISEAAPGGTDPSVEQEFDKVKAEIDKLTSVAGEAPNWRAVDELGREILTKKGKDFRVAIWLAAALFEKGKWKELAEGLIVLRSLTVDFWTQMFPDAKRGRARANQIGWLMERVTPKLEKLDVGKADGEAVKLVDTLFNELDSAWSEKLGDFYSGLGGMRGTMRNHVRSIPVEAPPPPPPPPPSEKAATSSDNEAQEFVYETSGSGGGGEMPHASSPDDVADTLLQYQPAIAECAQILRRADPSNAWAYRLQRVAAWMPVAQTPSNDNGTTFIPGPDILSTLDGLLGSQSWMELLHNAEDGLGTYLFALDLNRYSAVAMDRLGALFLAARETLGRETVAFVDRHKGIENLMFSDGTPFASPATKSWLDEERAKWGGGGGGSKANAEDEEVLAKFEEAKGMVQGGQVGEGLSLAISLSNRMPDARRKFRARTLVARMAIDGGKPELARPVLDALLAEIERHRLEVWEPESCGPVLAAMLECMATGPGQVDEAGAAAFQSRRNQTFERLCRIDPAAALRVASVGESA